MAAIRMALYGTKHPHAAGKLKAIRDDPDVAFAGAFEADPEQRRTLEASGGPYQGIRWFDDLRDMLNDPTIVAVAAEGGNHENLDHTEACIAAGKHVWCDKPAGEDWAHWQRIVASTEAAGLLIQLGYMYRYHAGFQQIASWARSGFLGDLVQVRARIGTNTAPASRRRLSRYRGGIFFELAGHAVDQVVWLLGRPQKVTPFLRNDSSEVPDFVDNVLAVYEYDSAFALIDMSALEPSPPARRIEVYGTRGSAIMQPFDKADHIRLALTEAQGGYERGEQIVPIESQTRQQLYERELAAFRAVISGAQPPDRSFEDELITQETLLRTTGHIAS